ncbi:hypothetical protein ACFXTN_023773 [Malus domestica]
MSLKKLWSEREKSLLAEDNLQRVPITEDGNLRDYLDGITKVENEKFVARSAGKKSRGDGSWPETTAKSP